MRTFFALATSLALATATRLRAGQHSPKGPSNLPEELLKRALDESNFVPANATNVQSFVTPTNVTIRYKEPGKHGVCETTPGVNSYSGYIDLDDNTHVFFWFFESRRNPESDPITLWLNGGPGSDSLLGLLEENGPCRIMEKDGKYVSVLNPNSWNEVSNLLYLSQPVGVGFSYQSSGVGALANQSIGGQGTFLDPSQVTDDSQKVTGRWPTLLPTELGTISSTDQAAQATWHVLQGFLSGLNTLAPRIGSPTGKVFNFATESYGGHYAPSFYKYFYEQNQAILNGSAEGVTLDFNTVLIINGLIDFSIQAPFYSKYAVGNPYNVKGYNQTVYDYVEFALNMENGCLDQIAACQAAASSIKGGIEGGNDPEATPNNITITQTALDSAGIAFTCAGASLMCNDNIQGPFYFYSDRNQYDIRWPRQKRDTPDVLRPYLNQPEIQQALGVNLNWTAASNEIYFAFHHNGDDILTNFKPDLESILDLGVRVALFYGDADYICNYLGGEAVSLALNYSHTADFSKAGYQPFLVDDYQYGDTREYGNFSFTRIFDSGHEIPYYQPLAALKFFNRTINLVDIPSGTKQVTGDLRSEGPPNSTKTYPEPVFPARTAKAALAAYSNSVVKHYNDLFTQTEPPKASATAQS